MAFFLPTSSRFCFHSFSHNNLLHARPTKLHLSQTWLREREAANWIRRQTENNWILRTKKTAFYNFPNTTFSKWSSMRYWSVLENIFTCEFSVMNHILGEYIGWWALSYTVMWLRCSVKSNDSTIIGISCLRFSIRFLSIAFSCLPHCVPFLVNMYLILTLYFIQIHWFLCISLSFTWFSTYTHTCTQTNWWLSGYISIINVTITKSTKSMKCQSSLSSSSHSMRESPWIVCVVVQRSFVRRRHAMHLDNFLSIYFSRFCLFFLPFAFTAFDWISTPGGWN